MTSNPPHDPITSIALDLALARASRPPDQPEDEAILRYIEAHIRLCRERSSGLAVQAILAGALALMEVVTGSPPPDPVTDRDPTEADLPPGPEPRRSRPTSPRYRPQDEGEPHVEDDDRQ